MKLGKIKNFLFIFISLYLSGAIISFAEEKIQSVPLINIEALSPTFEEDKDELEKLEKSNTSLNSNENILEEPAITKDDKIYINLKALDKITAKTSSIRLAVGEKKFFGPLEIKALKCQSFEGEDISDTVA